MSGSQKGEKVKNEGERGKGTSPLNPMEVHEQVRGGREFATVTACLFAPLESPIKLINESIDSQYLKDRVLFAHLAPASYSRNSVQLPAIWLGVGDE